jgi:hypothetical protein
MFKISVGKLKFELGITGHLKMKFYRTLNNEAAA